MNCRHKIGPHLGCMILRKPCHIFNTVKKRPLRGVAPPLKKMSSPSWGVAPPHGVKSSKWAPPHLISTPS